MDDFFDHMLDSSEESSDESSDIDNEELAAVAAELQQLEPPVVNIPVQPQMVIVPAFDPNNNLLNPHLRDVFKTEIIFPETHLFTTPISTTNTMEGYLSNVQFHEEELIEDVFADENIVDYKCNYGRVTYPGYTEYIQPRKTNRGRKKKTKVKKNRKKQGTGEDFNSQITVIGRSPSVKAVNGIVPYGAKVYKFKVFRTGNIQLPGVQQGNIDDVICCAQQVSAAMNFYLHPGEADPTKSTQLIHVSPVMKNYKFLIKLPTSHIIDMEALRRVIAAERLNPSPDSPARPHIFLLKYTRQDTKLSIKFSTPLPRKPKKRTRINIFMRGKVNILGAFDSALTTQICEFLHWIFERHNVVVEECSRDSQLPTWEPNLKEPTDEEVSAIMEEFIHWHPPLPELSDVQYDEILQLACNVWDEKMTACGEAILDIVRGTELAQIFALA
jgi:hypothetical protein